MLKILEPAGSASLLRASTKRPSVGSNHKVVRPFGSHSCGCFIRIEIRSPCFFGSIKVRNSAAGKRRRACPSTAPQFTEGESGRPESFGAAVASRRSEEHTSELQSLMRISYAVFCLKKKKQMHEHKHHSDSTKPTSAVQPIHQN